MPHMAQDGSRHGPESQATEGGLKSEIDELKERLAVEAC